MVGCLTVGWVGYVWCLRICFLLVGLGLRVGFGFYLVGFGSWLECVLCLVVYWLFVLGVFILLRDVVGCGWVVELVVYCLWFV